MILTCMHWGMVDQTDSVDESLESDDNLTSITHLLTTFGAVPVTGKNFYKLLKQNENILLYPGGSREVCHDLELDTLVCFYLYNQHLVHHSISAIDCFRKEFLGVIFRIYSILGPQATR